MVQSQEKNEQDTVVECLIIGGGAAGLFCAAQAAKRGRKVIVIERAKQVGRKILMSGGGRCNFTNYSVKPENFISNNSHFSISALTRYTSEDFIELVSSYGLQYHEKKLGQLFCNNKSKDILTILLKECEYNGVNIQTNCLIDQISHDSTQTYPFQVNTNLGQYHCQSLVVATGGLSIPSMGATGFGYSIAKQFGIQVTQCQPSLVPLIAAKKNAEIHQQLAGLSLRARVSCGFEKKTNTFTENILFTHLGFSGPAILQISNYWNYGEKVLIDFLPDQSFSELIEIWKHNGERSLLKNLCSKILPKRFVNSWVFGDNRVSHLSDQCVNDLCRDEIMELEKIIHHFEFIPAGTEGYQVAEVTRGGVDTNEVSSKTFESKKIKGLYFIGEVLDVTGWLGGYNFQWAWSSGYCAGLVI